MSTEAFNPNPIIFATAKSSRLVPGYAKTSSLWLDQVDDQIEEEDESNEIEDIDQDEIFGTSLCCIRGIALPASKMSRTDRSHCYDTTLQPLCIQNSSVPSRTRNIET